MVQPLASLNVMNVCPQLGQLPAFDAMDDLQEGHCFIRYLWVSKLEVM